MADSLDLRLFRDTPLNDPFFDSLKQDYKEFPEWFGGKAIEKVYAQYTDGKLIGFMYPKLEDGPVDDVTPHLSSRRRIKIGTLKVEAHGTKLGERLIKKALDHAVMKHADELYVTIFPRHKPLISLLRGLGFEQHGTKKTGNGTELVLVKRVYPHRISGDLRRDYPVVDTRSGNFHLLAIYPEYHSQLFPDSILSTESYDFLSDVSHTNSISKTYICAMQSVNLLVAGDKIVIYRTSDGQGPAEYRSVVTSICVVEEARSRLLFGTKEAYFSYAQPFSVLSKAELGTWWENASSCVIKMLYSAALTKRLIRKTLAEDVGLDRQSYWGFMQLSRDQFLKICELGGVSERLIVS
jgi:GNAT superfamily N-acetyltransferase